MRRLTQTLVPDGPLLCLEDDTLVPRDVYSRLARVGSGSVTGVQVSRHEGINTPGIQGATRRHGIEPITSCGHYCLLTTGEAYRKAKILSRGAVDIEHTKQLPDLKVDWGCVCGHLLEGGDILTYRDGQVVTRRAAGALRVGALVHMYPPHHNAGAEHMLHAIFSGLVSLGVDCRVAVESPSVRTPFDYTLDGVRVGSRALLDDCDIIFTHLDRTREAEAYCRAHKKPLVHIIHNHHQPERIEYGQLAVYNTEWLREEYPTNIPNMVIHPPVYPDRYRVIPGECVTLINLIPPKGVHIFYELAKRMPEVSFLGVKGAYGTQVSAPRLPNLQIMENQADVREVYSRTRVLLTPSVYESYGRVAVEAAISGIPVIANSTPGLIEALGDSGIYPKRKEPLTFDTSAQLSLDNVPAWEHAVKKTLKSWKKHSTRASEHVRNLDPMNDIERLSVVLQTMRGA